MRIEDVVDGQQYVRDTGRIILAKRMPYGMRAIVVEDPLHPVGKVLEFLNWTKYAPLTMEIDTSICDCPWKRHPLYCKCK